MAPPNRTTRAGMVRWRRWCRSLTTSRTAYQYLSHSVQITDAHMFAAAQREFDRRYVLRSNLNWNKYWFEKVNHTPFIVNEHHEIICDALDQVIAGKIKRLMINIAPRYGKTELAVKGFISKGLAHNPAAKFIHVSYSKSLALDNSEAIKDLVMSADYQGMFPGVQLKQDSRSKNKWYTKTKGGLYATASGGQVTGFGAGRVDPEVADQVASNVSAELKYINSYEGGFGGALVIDDALKPEDAVSDIKRERVNKRYDGTLVNRTNSRNTPIVIMGQRLDPYDLCGYLLDKQAGEWTVIVLPALRDNGTALWKHKHNVAELKAMKKDDPVNFETQYQQNPKPSEGVLFPEKELHYFVPGDITPSDIVYKYIPVDPADTGGDDNAAALSALIGDKVYITKVYYNTKGTDYNQPAIVELAVRNKVNHVDVEGVGGWITFGKNIRKGIQDKYEDCEVRIIKPHKDKKSRITGAAAWIRNHCVFLHADNQGEEYRKFMRCLTSYLSAGTSKHDDAPDMLAMLYDHYQKTFGHLW